MSWAVRVVREMRVIRTTKVSLWIRTSLEGSVGGGTRPVCAYSGKSADGRSSAKIISIRDSGFDVCACGGNLVVVWREEQGGRIGRMICAMLAPEAATYRRGHQIKQTLMHE